MANAADTVVVGLGESGFACARHLAARGVRVAVTDSRADPPRHADARRLLPQVPLVLGGLDGALLRGASQVVLSPGVDRRQPELVELAAAGIEVIGEMELFVRVATAPVVAITGSNGKSTVTVLVGEMARRAGLDAAVGGNLGTPALALLREPEPDCYVLELSSFQLESVVSWSAAAAAVLNVSPDHMDRYDDLPGYARAKQAIYRGDGIMVLNADDPWVAAMAEPGRRAIWFTMERPAAADGYGVVTESDGEWLARGEERLLAVLELAMAGRHNIANALAALALGEAMGFPRPAMLASLRDFRGLAHRMELIAERGGVRFYNDSKATNVGATQAAITSQKRPVVLIAGGQGKGQDFKSLAATLQGRARAAVLIGEDAPRLGTILDGVCPIHHAADMDAAVAQAVVCARPGDAVLLSPACASFDLFDGYAARGEAFRAAVMRLRP